MNKEAKRNHNRAYYMRNRERRAQYFRKHHDQWRKTKKMANELGITLTQTRAIINRALRGWYLEKGLLHPRGGHHGPRLFPKRTRRKLEQV